MVDSRIIDRNFRDTTLLISSMKGSLMSMKHIKIDLYHTNARKFLFTRVLVMFEYFSQSYKNLVEIEQSFLNN